MLSIFPYLLTFEALSPILLRITLGLIFIIWGYKEIKGIKKILGVFELIIGIALVVGIFTQIVALFTTIFFGIEIFKKIKNKSFFTNGVNYYFILFIISISLLLTGSGLVAFDMPL